MSPFVQNEVTKRFLELFDHLLKKKVILSKADFCKRMDFIPQSLTKVLQGERDITVDFISKLALVFHINPSYLHTGIGEKFTSAFSPTYFPLTNDDQLVVKEPDSDRYTAKTSPSDFQFIPGFAPSSENRIVPGLFLPNRWITAENPVVMEWDTESMSPLIPLGTWMILSKIEFSPNFHFEANQIYLIIDTSGKSRLGWIKDGDDSNSLTINTYHPDKMKFPDQKIIKDGIKEAWKTEAYLTKTLSNSDQSTTDKIKTLENGIAQISKELGSLKQKFTQG